MRYKAKHISKTKQTKKIFSLKSFIILSMVCISLTVIPSYAYFTGTSTVTLNGMGVSNLQIQNGTVQLDLADDGTTLWKNVIATSTPVAGTSSITNPFSGQQITYGPVYLNSSYSSSDTNLVSNIDIQTEYIMKKNGGTPEVVNSTSGESVCEPFEVIVGDIDNFNFGAAADYDYYSGNTTSSNIDIFPQSYDSQGTDRRMVPSGFYEFGKGVFTQVDGGNINNGLKLTAATNATLSSVGVTGYYQALVNSTFSINGTTFPKNLLLYYDGYVDKAITGKLNAGSAASDCNIDGVNWRYLQKSKPVTFKYASIPDNQGISSVNFQIFFNDLQSGSASNPTSFSISSSSYFRLYLSKKNGVDKVEVTQFAKILNKYEQGGPKGNMITLNLPESYFDKIKSASGLDSGLELLVDDGRSGTSGDSFLMDFAKMTVNNPAAKGSVNTVTVTGKVVDTSGANISGVKVTTGDGRSATTDSSGVYTISNAAPGILSLTFSHYKYKDEVYVYGNAVSGSTVNLTGTSQILLKGVKASITANEKFKVKFTLQKCDGSGNPIGGESPIVIESKNLNATSDYAIKNGNGTGTQILQAQCLAKIQPGFRYKLTYTLTLSSYDDIGDVMPFNLSFSSRIKAKMTQENNPAWGSDGSGSAYTNSVTEYSAATTTTGTTTYSDASKTQVYFERPTTDSYWSTFASGTKPVLTLDKGTTSIPNVYSTSTMEQDTANNGWYKCTFANNTTMQLNSIITVVDGVTTNTSKKLYYFSTQKVFICTN